ncbi:hypothetical protein QBZ16_005175 [Prototheca wickerhamii]|uniref:C2H2-type domain-containing protein n=1 Tax=Prototheca wickerhamii TaxID=3111 RepID=A0AAD9IIX8_PROWI|nr:hypothetical protein QBZ16_005175 [Prototheca wickerhamii]
MSQLFKSFGKEGHRASAQSQLKSSVARGIRAKISEQYPWLVENNVLEELLPKKQELMIIKLPEHVQLLVAGHTPLFFSTRDGGWFPTLRLLHKYPDMMPRLRTDKGAIKFVLSGANVMCPGLTSPGATIHDEASSALVELVEAGTPVALYAEDKEYAMAIGYTIMSTEEMRSVNKGIVRYFVEQHESQLQRPSLVKTVAGLVSEMNYQNKHLVGAMIVAGYDAVGGAQVYGCPIGGTLSQEDWTIDGSGSTYIWGYLDAEYRDGMSRQEAEDLVSTAIQLAMARDGSSGGVVRLVTITETGVERRLIKPEEHMVLWDELPEPSIGVVQDEATLITHQKSKHFKCEICHKRMVSIKSLAVHSLQVHKIPVTAVPDAIPGRESMEYDILGMKGPPAAAGPSSGLVWKEETVSPEERRACLARHLKSAVGSSLAQLASRAALAAPAPARPAVVSAPPAAPAPPPPPAGGAGWPAPPRPYAPYPPGPGYGYGPPPPYPPPYGHQPPPPHSYRPY